MKTRVVVLAAGKGTRMNSAQPKVLEPVNGKPLVRHLVDTIRESGVDRKPVVVIGHAASDVKNALGDTCEYVLQDEQKGTGHATKCAEKVLAGNADNVIVLYGDQPYVKADTIKRLAETQSESSGPFSMAIATVSDFDDTNSSFYSFARVVRGADGKIMTIVEKKDATPEELEIREINPGYYCFRADWLWANLERIRNDNAAGEYYLTDLVRIAIEDGNNIAFINIEPAESIGVNTQEDLARVREVA